MERLRRLPAEKAESSCQADKKQHGVEAYAACPRQCGGHCNVGELIHVGLSEMYGNVNIVTHTGKFRRRVDDENCMEKSKVC